METNVTTISDNFSWRRVISLAGFYRGSINKSMIICGIATVGCFVTLLLTMFAGRGFLMLYMLMSVAMSLSITLNPLVFNNRNQTLMAQVPVSPKEATTFYFLFSAVFMPLATQALWIVLSLVGGLLSGIDLLTNSYTVLLMAQTGINSKVCDMMPFGFIIFNSILQSLSGIAIVLWVVMCTKRHRRTARAILWYFGIYFLFGLATGIVGFVYGFSDGIQGINNSQEEITKRILDIVLPMIYAFDTLCVILWVLAVRRIYRHLRG